jgi:hypothetical protein
LVRSGIFALWDQTDRPFVLSRIRSLAAWEGMERTTRGRHERGFGGERKDRPYYNRHYRSKEVASSSSNSASAEPSNSPTDPQNLVGTCLDMCPGTNFLLIQLLILSNSDNSGNNTSFVWLNSCVLSGRSRGFVIYFRLVVFSNQVSRRRQIEVP